MRKIELPGVEGSVPQIGLGCARLDGRVGLRQASRLIETALDLGIRYFDVAESYGVAEEALGAVLAGQHDVVIATKVGPPRLPYNEAKMRIKHAIKPLLDRTRGLKLLLRGRHTPPPRLASERPRYDFSPERVRRALEASLQRLRRDRVNIYLAHEPNPLDLNPDTQIIFDEFVTQGLIGAYGVGIDARQDRWSPFGSIWQSGWPAERMGDYRQEVAYNFHGVLRYAPKDRWGATVCPARELVRGAVEAMPNALLLVSASTSDRLRALVSGACG
ncbi:aldo/keto reductase [Botrimarina hoheduenensis]|uniref:2,5-diketo-D-gluconate reductase B n=1 Tax=Botrimarina hoheduenensis TaxID=2528000 RepID=A0A5C5W903_9BACT|nr:aldo/keto reductase [Botrimarina hoheduenensis]TWT47366.1 2,5-diketo-D-gluconate reductase B [Botrimarina hoheduenensis]